MPTTVYIYIVCDSFILLEDYTIILKLKNVLFTKYTQNNKTNNATGVKPIKEKI